MTKLRKRAHIRKQTGPHLLACGSLVDCCIGVLAVPNEPEAGRNAQPVWMALTLALVLGLTIILILALATTETTPLPVDS